MFSRRSSFDTALQLVLRPHFLVNVVIRCPRLLAWSRTSLLGVGLTDLGHFGRYFGQNKEIVSAFNGSVVYFNVGIPPNLQFRNWVPELPLALTYLGHGGGGPSVYIPPPSVHQRAQKTYSQLAVAPARARGVSGPLDGPPPCQRQWQGTKNSQVQAGGGVW
jgi:hypothetical protein